MVARPCSRALDPNRRTYKIETSGRHGTDHRPSGTVNQQKEHAMKLVTRISDSLINRLAPKAQAEAACTFISKYSPNCDKWCVYSYDNCPSKTALCNW
jgi:hypothetical protein